jgi:hypothetical protein
MNDFVWLGFNQALDGSKVFDGALNFIGGGNGLGINYRFAQVGRTERNRQHHIAQLEGVFPFSYTTTTDSLTGKTDGKFVRCSATEDLPQSNECLSSNEMWVKSGSLLTTHPNTGLDVEETNRGAQLSRIQRATRQWDAIDVHIPGWQQLSIQFTSGR